MTELERSSLLLGPSARGADERGFESLPRPAHSERAGLTVMQGMPLRSLQPIQTDRTSLDSTPHLQLSICSPPPRCSSALIWGQFNKHPGAASVLLLFYISFNILQPQTPNASPASLALHVAISGGSSLRAGALGEKVAQGLFLKKKIRLLFLFFKLLFISLEAKPQILFSQWPMRTVNAISRCYVDFVHWTSPKLSAEISSSQYFKEKTLSSSG